MKHCPVKHYPTYRRWAILTCATLLLAGSLSCSKLGQRDVRIVIVTLDTLRYDSLPASGEEPPRMPKVAEWAEQATRFVHCFSATSTTQPTHASMFTGLHPWQHGVTRNGQKLVEERETIAELLQAAGFSTKAVVASFPVSKASGLDQGFELFVDELDRGKVQTEYLEAADAEGSKAPAKKASLYTLAENVTRRALDALDETEGPRQFFWFHYFDAHDPYGDTGGQRRGAKFALRIAERGQDPTAALRKARELYDLDVASLDHWLRILLDRIDRDADEIETHVLLVSDHGESFGEDGSVAHGSRLTPSMIRVPCVIRSPKLEPGTRADAAGSTDIFATLMSLASLDPIAERGRDLRSPDPNARVFGMRRVYSAGQSVRRLDGKRYPVGHPWFYTVLREGVLIRGNSEKIELPAEGKPDLLSAAAEDRIKKLFEVFELELEGNFRQEELDEETLKALEALGYVQ